MRKLKLNALWKPSFIGANDKEGKFGIYSPVLIQQVLQYERSRADREGGYFSVVLFSLKEPESQNARFVKLLKNSTRLIDHLGWYDAATVCVVLTATDTDGAELFARKIQGSVETMSGNGRHPAPPYEVFSYPDQERGQGDGKLKISRNIYRDNDLCINEKLKQFLGNDIPVWKRSLDIFGSLAGLILLAPLFALVALHIKLVSKGPVLYTQQRVGYKGRSFTFLKFRTMHTDREEVSHQDLLKDLINNSDKPMQKLDRKDPRIIPGAKILRSASIDELPQLWNVFKGNMSLVGPRPCIPYEAEEFLRWHAQRFDIMPGCTGLWQVSGKNHLSFHEMICMDIKYAREYSLLLDLKLILLTFPAILEMVWEKVNSKLSRNQMYMAGDENG